MFLNTTKTPATYTVATITTVYDPNHTLVCGFPGEPSVTLSVPDNPTDARAWNRVFQREWEGRVSVVIRRNRRESRPTFTCICNDKRRFTLWASSTCLELLGFAPNRHYEAVEVPSQRGGGGGPSSVASRMGSSYAASSGQFVLVAPQPMATSPSTPSTPSSPSTSSSRARVPLVRRAPCFGVVDRSIHPTHATHPSTRICSLHELIPLRPQYSKERDHYLYLSPYQQFPIHFLSPLRSQRGILLYHETGSGKSRTSIEMAQRYVEQTYWASVSGNTPLRQPYTPSTRPNVLLFSPKQEASGHFLNEVGRWSGCWWSRTTVASSSSPSSPSSPSSSSSSPDTQWAPFQHHYTTFSLPDLLEEMRNHERDVRRYLETYVYLPIVLDNTRSLYQVVKVFREAANAKRALSPAHKALMVRYFRAVEGSSLFDMEARQTTDARYGQLMANTFVILDEMHQLTNEISNAVEQQKGDSGAGTFFYRALMEAPHCRVVGLSGTPMSKTPLSFAPLFNLLSGKCIRCTIEFADTLPDAIRYTLFARARSYAETVWIDLWQSNKKAVAFTPWSRPDVYEELFGEANATRPVERSGVDRGGWLNELQRTYPKQITVTVRDNELFPFAFHYPHANARDKTYTYDNTSFKDHFVKNGRVQHPVEFAERISGLVSYISPPKQMTNDTSSASPTSPTTNPANTYPHHDIRTVHLAAAPSHLSYLQSITTQQRAINQTKTDTEARGGCNVNWSAAPARVLYHNGKQYKGMAKLFLKGHDPGAQQQSRKRAEEHLERQWHALLYHAHRLFAEASLSKGGGTLTDIRNCMRLNGTLEAFSPKYYSVLQTLVAAPTHKAVVYSEFIDGIGKYGAATPQSPHIDSNRLRLDATHVGLSGLGLFRYVLVTNGFVPFEVVVKHPLEPLYARLQNLYRNRAPVVSEWIARHDVLHADAVGALANALGGLTPSEKTSAQHDIAWDRMQPTASTAPRLTIAHLIRRLIQGGQRLGRFPVRCVPLPYVKWRLALAPTCRQALGLASTHASTQASTQAPTVTPPQVFMEYSDRTLINLNTFPLSNDMRKVAKEQLLHVYNVQTEADVDQLGERWTAEAVEDVRALLARQTTSNRSRASTSQSRNYKQSRKHKSSRKRSQKRTTTTTTHTGNAYSAIVQTLLASTGVTESVEFKDVRTMHILEPPVDYRKLEQMFGRVIRRGSHSGLRAPDRDVVIRLYVLSSPYTLQQLKDRAIGNTRASSRHTGTADELYWGDIIKRKYEISQEFYQLMKHMAVDCRNNLVLNSASNQDRALTCFEYPYQTDRRDWEDEEMPLFAMGGYERGSGEGGKVGRVDVGWVWGGV